MKVFPLSLADDVKEWWISEEKITTWEELVEKFICRLYPESYDGEYEMLDEGKNWGIDPLEFLSNVNTAFKNHKKFDERTQKVIFHSWMNGNWNKRYERISHERTKNQSKRDKTGHGMEKCVETKPNQRADYSNWETSFIKERKGEIKNEKKSDVEGPFLYTNQTFL
ncbi:hypothetical protein Tco_1102649 [Tanacetum coccineum]